MNRNTLLFILTVMLAYATGAKAQQTLWHTEITREVALGKTLYQAASYNASFRQFEKIAQTPNIPLDIATEARYYMAVSALRSGHKSGEQLLVTFIGEDNTSPYVHHANFHLAEHQFELGRHTQVLRTLSNINEKVLTDTDQISAHYMRGYSHMMGDQLDLALNSFVLVKDKNHIMSRPATYYHAHIHYLRNNFETALQGFRSLQEDANFSKIIPVYVSQIYYKQQRYNDVVNYTVPIINQMEEQYKPELAKIIGDAYFQLKRYTEAIQFLEYYHQMPGQKSREDNYLLGFCYHTTGSWDKSLPYLEAAARGTDQLAQSAYYHLADGYIRTGQKERARAAFESAAEMTFDDRIREDALFNYAKLTYELSYSPFNETIKAFDRYISLYPNSERNTQAYQYLVEVFMVTRNYRDAIASIEKIAVKNNAINQAYQRVTYYRGIELFGNNDFSQAIAHFDKSLQQNISAQLTASARYWRAEALYRSGNFTSSANGYNQFLVSPGAFSLPEYNDGHYGLGYAYFKLEDYARSADAFRKYLNAVRSQSVPKVADAHNRLGDNYFQQRNYTEAVKSYQAALNMRLYDADYSLYQLAFTSGLMRDRNGKINQLRNLINSFPQSAYIDDARFELSRTYQEEGQFEAAASEYRILIDNHRESVHYPRALLQMGLINYNTGDYASSLRYYKEVVEKFTGTADAQAALMGIRNCYVEMNDVDAYFAYANSVGRGVTVTRGTQDSLLYVSAERQFMAGDPNAAAQLQRYLDQFPNGGFALNAHFYLGEALYGSGQYSRALEHYVYVTRQPLNPFSENAYVRGAELLFNATRYGEALELYNRLETIANSKTNTIRALTGKMRSSYRLERYSDAIANATRLQQAEKPSESLLREANYITAKSHYNLTQIDQALPLFQTLAAETNSVEGAESKYLVAEIHFKRQAYSQAEAQVMDYISKGTPHQFWLAKSFLLLADVYIARNDNFQARHTLQSLIDNYPEENDGIKAEGNSRLAQIEARERLNTESAPENRMQINLN